MPESNPFCPTCGHQLDDHDHVFGVWLCPHCDEVLPEDDPLELLYLPEAP